MIRRLSAGSFQEGDARRLAVPGPAASRPASEGGSAPDVQAMAAEGYRAGYTEGFEQGREDGLREADIERQAMQVELGERVAAQQQLLEQAHDQFLALIQALPAAWDAFRTELAESASEVALVGLRHLFEDAEAYRECIRGMCAELAGAHTGAGAVHIAPDDLALLGDAIDGMPVVADPAMTRGTCRIDHPRGASEASIEGRLKNIYESLVEALGGVPG